MLKSARYEEPAHLELHNPTDMKVEFAEETNPKLVSSDAVWHEL